MFLQQKTPNTIKYLIYINIAIFILNIIVELSGFNFLYFFGLVPELVVKQYYLWQIFTYMFMHAGVFHILFNMLMLWMLGRELCDIWGKNFFIKYYLLCGIGAGLCVVLLSFLSPSSFSIPTVGSSGAIFGLLLAYGTIFKNRLLYFFGLFPIKAGKLVLILGAVELVLLISSNNSSISHLAHLGGLLTGLIYLKIKTWQRNRLANKHKNNLYWN